MKATTPTPIPNKRALSISEFAERWGIGRNSVYNLIASGQLDSVKIGARRVITLEQEEAFRKLKEGEGES